MGIRHEPEKAHKRKESRVSSQNLLSLLGIKSESEERLPQKVCCRARHETGGNVPEEMKREETYSQHACFSNCSADYEVIINEVGSQNIVIINEVHDSLG